MSTMVTSQDPCPTCLLTNKVVNQLQDRPGQFFTTCRAGHKFEDTEELNNLRSQVRIAFPMLYKDPNTPTQRDPQELANMNIVLDPESKKAIEELAGTVLTGASDLKGLVFAYIKDNEDKEGEIKRLRAQMATARNRPVIAGQSKALASNQVIVELPEWSMEGIAEQAAHADQTIDAWISQEINAYFENYFSQAPSR